MPVELTGLPSMPCIMTLHRLKQLVHAQSMPILAIFKTATTGMVCGFMQNKT